MSRAHREGHWVQGEHESVTKRFDNAEIEGRSAVRHCIDTDEQCLPDVKSVEWNTDMFSAADAVVRFSSGQPPAPLEIKARRYDSGAWDSWFIRKHKMDQLFSIAHDLTPVGDVPVVDIAMTYADSEVRIWEVQPSDLDDYELITKRLKDKTLKASGWSTVEVYLLPSDHVSLSYSTIEGEAHSI